MPLMAAVAVASKTVSPAPDMVPPDQVTAPGSVHTLPPVSVPESSTKFGGPVRSLSTDSMPPVTLNLPAPEKAAPATRW